MPKLIRLYIVSVAIGFVLALAFVTLLVVMDIGHLRHLITGSPMGWVAFVMMVMFNGVVFAGVQFAIAVMRLAEDDSGPRGGLRQHLVPVRVTADARSRPVRPRR